MTKGIPVDGLPISDYALLSDCRSAALVSPAGSVDWLCFPRFDAPAVLARILDPGAGHFTICPAGDFEASYEGPWRDLVHHSGRVLQALTFAPIGNFPQAFSHIGLVNAAWAIAQAQQRAASEVGPAVPVGAGQAREYGS